MSKYKPSYDIGYVGKACTGEVFTVINYEGRKKITIRFECGLVRNTTSTHIKQNSVKFSTMRVKPLKVGDEVTNKGGDIKAIILSIDNTSKRYTLKFENGLIKEYSKGCILSKEINDREAASIKEGDVFKTNNYGEVTVLEYKNAHIIHVVFEDGVTTTCQASALRLGTVAHPKSMIPEGYTFTNNDGCKGTVVNFHNCLEVDVEWDLGGVTTHNASSIKKGSAYCPSYKSVTGVGYFGIGKYKPNKAGKNLNYNERVYASWQRMIRRCYDEKEQLKPSCRAYKNVKVCDEWHNFQNFALWAEDKEDKFTKGWDLDKDMFGNGRLYSPENCCMLPSKVNWFLCDGYSCKTSGLPEGVNEIKPKSKNAKVGYVARCHINGKREYLGYYDCPYKAGEVYRQAKEKEARRLADEYKHMLTEKQYEKLYNFKLEDIHRKGGSNE